MAATCRYPLDNYPGTPETGSANIHWMQDSRHLLVSTFEGTRCRLLRVDTAGGSMERLAAAVQNFWSYSASADGRTIAIGAEDAHAPPNVVILRDCRQPVRLTELNPQLSASGWVRQGNQMEKPPRRQDDLWRLDHAG